MTPTVATKVCKLCGTNLNGHKRTKNAAGEYFCQLCWESLRSNVGGVAGQRATEPSDATALRGRTGVPAVKVVRSEAQKTIGQAMLTGAREGAAEATFKAVSKAFFFLQFIAALALAKRVSPDLNNGMMIIIGLTAGIAAIVEIDLIARAMNIRSRWLDAETLKSRAGRLGMIGFGLAYALAIFLAITGA